MQDPENDTAWDITGPELQDPTVARLVGERVNSFLLKVLYGRDEAFRLPNVRPFVRPARLVVPTERKDAWLGQLAAHDPLNVLVRNVPHGIRVSAALGRVPRRALGTRGPSFVRGV